MYKLEFYVPETHLKSVNKAIFKAGAGRIGSYDCCAWLTMGKGQFRPLKGSNPFLGKQDKIKTIKEYKVEVICENNQIKDVIDALKSSHPYETPAYQYWQVNQTI